MWAGRENGYRQRLQPLRDGLRRTDDGRRWRRQRRHQHQATDAAIIDAGMAVARVGGGLLRAGDERVADDTARNGGGRGGLGAGAAETGQQPGERNRISGDQRNQALT